MRRQQPRYFSAKRSRPIDQSADKYEDDRCYRREPPAQFAQAMSFCPDLMCPQGLRLLVERTRFDKIELLDETHLAEAASGPVTGLNVDSKSPSAEIHAEIRSALSAGAADLPALIDRATASRGKQVLCCRAHHHSKIDLGAGYLVLEVVIGAEREIQWMTGVCEKPA